MKIDHITFAVGDSKELHSDEFCDFLLELGLYEVDASSDILEKGWDVRWFKGHRSPTVIHFVVDKEVLPPPWGLTHICLNVGVRRFNRLRATSQRVEHDSGKPVGDTLCRFWLVGPGGVRIEARP